MFMFMSMQLPVVIVNFKAYKSAFGEAAVRLALIHQEAVLESGVSLAICVSALDLQAVCKAVSIPVFVQHVDSVDYGAYTGFLPPAAAKAVGAFGALLNHAEHKLSDEILAATVQKCREAGLFTLVCAESIERMQGFLRLKFLPDFIALEPPELIGGDISVSTAQPELISEAVRVVGLSVGGVAGSKLLVGAGVKNAADVAKSLELGASGVLLASAVTQAKNPKAALLNLMNGLKK